MTNEQAAESLENALKCTEANKSCRIEEEVLEMAIRALRKEIKNNGEQ